MTPEQIRGIVDPVERAREAVGFINRAKTAVVEVEQIRNDTIKQLAADGWSQRKIAKELRLSHARVAQITNGKSA